MKRFILVLSVTIGLLLPINFPAKAVSLTVAQDHQFGYNRALFKLWIDEDKDGCNTRAEVLIEEAIVKPKIGKKCALTGGKWLSPYDEKTTTKANDLDIDHLVPLAEAWRSGAWAWTPAQRQAFANDLSDSRALVAVSLGLNRSKGDSDVASWLPPKGICIYVESWIAVKIKYSLTADTEEMSVLEKYVDSCGLISLGTPTPTPTPPTPTLSTKSFLMPYIQGTLYIDVVLSGWSQYGFDKPPIVQVELPSTAIAGYVCKPRQGNKKLADMISSVTPKWNTQVTSETQVTITLYCEGVYQPTPTATATATTTPTPTPTPTISVTPTPASTPANPVLIKYANCTAAKAAGVTPIKRSTNPDLYALNSGLDRDKDGVACES